MNRILSILGGLLVAIGVFVPFASMAGISMSMMESGGLSGNKSVVYVIMGIGAIAALVGLVNKRFLNILNIILGLAAAGMGALLYSGEKEKSMDPGMGTWMIIVGGVLIILGAIMGVAKKKAAAVA